MYKSLVIGCGNIGALYDFDNDRVQSHVKGYYLNPETEVYIYDIDKTFSQKVAQKYGCVVVENISANVLCEFDIISICTPTTYHFQVLHDAIAAGVKTVICEKPVSNDEKEIQLLKEKYSTGKTKILVNYIRRFQKAYSDLKTDLKQILAVEQLSNISIKYQRGFINNCSHAIDLLEYLFDQQMELENVTIHNKVFDQFENDETLSLQAHWNGANISVLGLSNVLFSHFEIDLYFNTHRISIQNAGNTIKFYKSEIHGNTLQPLGILANLTKNNCISDYMIAVIESAVCLTKDHCAKDNFINSIAMNQRMLNYKKL